MTFFNPAEPILRRKQDALDIQDRCGLLMLRLRLGKCLLYASDYSRIDQVSLLWGIVSAGIFMTAQFAPISWDIQAAIWTTLSAIGVTGMVILAHFWVRVERLEWLLYSWVSLSAIGVVSTDLAIWLSWGWLLMFVCHLWLGLSAIGYFLLGFGLRSRAFCIAGSMHLLGIAILTLVPGWQLLATGAIMAVTSFLLAETQWDMRPPTGQYALLSEAERAFNQEQHRQRQAGVSLQSR